ncbi:MAG: penicillin-binding transpeptidase domain-containing protein [Desulfatibacillaceae bacterium]|nr:penicillin-binding transpeptidase domain-containing protein [Desulfatibacillaceae bacterium]
MNAMQGKKVSGNRWRSYQSSLKRRETVSRRRRILLVLLAVTILFALLSFLLPLVPAPPPKAPADAQQPTAPEPAAQEAALSMPDRAFVRSLLAASGCKDFKSTSLLSLADGKAYTLNTTIDSNLQARLESLLDTRHSKALGIVVSDPDTGRILALAGWADGQMQARACWEMLFPAASIFKVVTAAEALDQFGLSANSPMFFNGRKHTLYRSQLTPANNRYSEEISFAEAFAESINPVFGKLGIHTVGLERLLARANTLGFGRLWDLDMPAIPSIAPGREADFGIAEMASGFNRSTQMTPIHGAALAGALINGGNLIAPWIIESIEGENGEILYKGRPEILEKVGSRQAVDDLEAMMVQTVLTGTARSTFANAKRDRILKNLTIGGKTGSINDSDDHTIRYDLFVGFAKHNVDQRKLAVSVIVAHHEFIGTRAAQYARSIIRHHFQ